MVTIEKVPPWLDAQRTMLKWTNQMPPFNMLLICVRPCPLRQLYVSVSACIYVLCVDSVHAQSNQFHRELRKKQTDQLFGIAFIHSQWK